VIVYNVCRLSAHIAQHCRCPSEFTLWRCTRECSDSMTAGCRYAGQSAPRPLSHAQALRFYELPEHPAQHLLQTSVTVLYASLCPWLSLVLSRNSLGPCLRNCCCHARWCHTRVVEGDMTANVSSLCLIAFNSIVSAFTVHVNPAL
jgi:hypothetical protein